MCLSLHVNHIHHQVMLAQPKGTERNCEGGVKRCIFFSRAEFTGTLAPSQFPNISSRSFYFQHCLKHSWDEPKCSAFCSCSLQHCSTWADPKVNINKTVPDISHNNYCFLPSCYKYDAPCVGRAALCFTICYASSLHEWMKTMKQQLGMSCFEK